MTDLDLLPVQNLDQFKLDTSAIPDTPVWITRAKDPYTSGLEEMEDSLYIAYKKKVPMVIDYLARVGLPSPGLQYRLVTRRSFNAIELLAYVARKEKITDLKMAIYSINYYAALYLIEMLDRGLIDNCEILLSNLRNSAYREKEEILKNKFIKHPKISGYHCPEGILALQALRKSLGRRKPPHHCPHRLRPVRLWLEH